MYTLVLFLDRLDLTIVNIALPTVAHYFQVSILATGWVNMAFLLALALSIPISGWFGDQFGLKRVYIFAIALFGLGSGLCAWAPYLTTIIILRFIQGLGGGLLIPIGMTMLYRIYDVSEYASITSFTFLPSLVAPALGPFLGGLMLYYFDWRFVFIFSGPICLGLVLFSGIFLKDDGIRYPRKLDWGGFFLSTILLITVFYTLFIISQTGLTPVVLYGIALSIVSIIIFVWWEKKTTDPLINLHFFSYPLFVQANLLQLCFQICHFGAIFF